MSRTSKVKISPQLKLTAFLSGGLNIGLSSSYIIASLVALIYRYICNEPEDSHTVFSIINEVYIQDKSHCTNSTSQLAELDLTASYSVFVLVLITLIVSVCCLIASISLVAAASDDNGTQYIDLIIYIFIGLQCASLVVDITFATHLGMDYTDLNQMTDDNPLVYQARLLASGVIILIIIILKGIVMHIANIILNTLLVIFLIQYRKKSKENDHAIHQFGTLNAYGTGPQMNHGFLNDEMHSSGLRQDGSLAEFSSGPLPSPGFNHQEAPRTPKYDMPVAEFKRSNSWQRSQPGVRPFSYLEDTRPPPFQEMRLSPAPLPNNVERQKGRNLTPSIPVPEPDYSPQSTRRLKSALKNTYI